MTPLAEYLSTHYRPDCDYVDGEVRERNVGEYDHSSTQARILVWLGGHYPQLIDRLASEQRVQVRPERFRIPDVCVLDADAPEEPITRTPPALCVEILSKDDRMAEIMERFDDYFRMGVPVCWIIEPVKRRAWIATPEHLFEPADCILRADGFEMPLAAVLPRIAL